MIKDKIVYIETATGKEGKRDTDRQTETERERQRDREIKTKRQRDKDKDRERDKNSVFCLKFRLGSNTWHQIK